MICHAPIVACPGRSTLRTTISCPTTSGLLGLTIVCGSTFDRASYTQRNLIIYKSDKTSTTAWGRIGSKCSVSSILECLFPFAVFVHHHIPRFARFAGLQFFNNFTPKSYSNRNLKIILTEPLKRSFHILFGPRNRSSSIDTPSGPSEFSND